MYWRAAASQLKSRVIARPIMRCQLSRSRNSATARPTAEIRPCGVSSSKANPVAVPSDRLVAGVASTTVSASPPTRRTSGKRAITQRVELGQAARLEARGYEDHVGAADDQMRQALVIADLGRDPPRYCAAASSEAVLEIAVAGAEQGELAAARDKGGQLRRAPDRGPSAG